MKYFVFLYCFFVISCSSIDHKKELIKETNKKFVENIDKIIVIVENSDNEKIKEFGFDKKQVLKNLYSVKNTSENIEKLSDLEIYNEEKNPLISLKKILKTIVSIFL